MGGWDVHVTCKELLLCLHLDVCVYSPLMNSFNDKALENGFLSLWRPWRDIFSENIYEIENEQAVTLGYMKLDPQSFSNEKLPGNQKVKGHKNMKIWI